MKVGTKYSIQKLSWWRVLKYPLTTCLQEKTLLTFFFLQTIPLVTKQSFMYILLVKIAAIYCHKSMFWIDGGVVLQFSFLTYPMSQNKTFSSWICTLFMILRFAYDKSSKLFLNEILNKNHFILFFESKLLIKYGSYWYYFQKEKCIEPSWLWFWCWTLLTVNSGPFHAELCRVPVKHLLFAKGRQSILHPIWSPGHSWVWKRWIQVWVSEECDLPKHHLVFYLCIGESHSGQISRWIFHHRNLQLNSCSQGNYLDFSTGCNAVRRRRKSFFSRSWQEP